MNAARGKARARILDPPNAAARRPALAQAQESEAATPTHPPTRTRT